MRATTIFWAFSYCALLLGCSYPHKVDHIEKPNGNIISRPSPPELKDIQELFPKEGDVTCPDKHSETGEKMIFTSASLYAVSPDEESRLINESLNEIFMKRSDSIRMIESYTHYNYAIFAYELSHLELFNSEPPLTWKEHVTLMLECYYYDNNHKEIITRRLTHKPISRCFEAVHYISTNTKDRNLSDYMSGFFWCR